MVRQIRPRHCDLCGTKVWPTLAERKNEPWHVYDCPGCGTVTAHPLYPAGVQPRHVGTDHHQDQAHG